MFEKTISRTQNKKASGFLMMAMIGLILECSSISCSTSRKNIDAGEVLDKVSPSESATQQSIETGATPRNAIEESENGVAAVENEAAYVTEISFDSGSTELSGESRDRLSELVTKAKSAGPIRDIKVITWADMEYPSIHTKKLPKGQRDIAKKRNERIESYLKSADRTLDVDSFNMGERPNALANILRTENSKIKKSLEIAGIPNTDTFSKIPSKVGKSMILIIMK